MHSKIVWLILCGFISSGCYYSIVGTTVLLLYCHQAKPSTVYLMLDACHSSCALGEKNGKHINGTKRCYSVLNCICYGKHFSKILSCLCVCCKSSAYLYYTICYFFQFKAQICKRIYIFVKFYANNLKYDRCYYYYSTVR